MSPLRGLRLAILIAAPLSDPDLLNLTLVSTAMLVALNTCTSTKTRSLTMKTFKQFLLTPNTHEKPAHVVPISTNRRNQIRKLMKILKRLPKPTEQQDPAMHDITCASNRHD
jgi:hypothetical protein